MLDLKNEMLHIVTCRSCNAHEYYGMMHWHNGKTFCRKCIYRLWNMSNPSWHAGALDFIFPKYSDGVDYRLDLFMQVGSLQPYDTLRLGRLLQELDISDASREQALGGSLWDLEDTIDTHKFVEGRTV